MLKLEQSKSVLCNTARQILWPHDNSAAGLYPMDGDIVDQDIDLAHEFFVKSSEKGLWLADEVLEDWDEYFENS